MNFRDAFDLTPEFIHLNNAGATPLPRPSQKRLGELAADLGRRGAHFYVSMAQEIPAARKRYAEFLGTRPEHVAFTANLATAASLVARGLPFREGDRLLTTDQEYPSNAYIWHAVAREKRLRLEVFASEPDTSIHWDRFVDAIQPGVRAVILSWVQDKSGVTAPLARLSEACRRVGAWLIVDAIQGLGVVPWDWPEAGADIVCGGSHKWLCGLTGHGFIAFKDELYLQMDPVLQGAMTFGTPDDPMDPARAPLPRASRFEPGAPAHLLTLAGAESLRLLQECGVDRIAGHAMSLAQRLEEGLLAMGLTVLGETGARRRSPLVTFRHDREIQKVHEALLARQVSHAFRTQTVRLSPHGFNSTDEIDEALELVKRLL